MKTIVIGFMIFSAWSALATYLYVCRIKGLCNDQETSQTLMPPDKEISDSDKFKMQQRPIADLPGTLSVYFEFDKSEFVADAMTDRYIDKSNSYMVKNKNAVLKIVGHTDSVGTDDYNFNLGGRRAHAIKNYFGDKGLPADRFITESRGEREPSNENTTAEGRAKNRRTEITFK